MADELEVMSKIKRLLEPLDAAARTRAVNWIVDALEIQGVSPAKGGVGAIRSDTFSSLMTDSPPSTFADFFHAVGPKTEKEKALIAAYWIQRASGVEQFASQQVNAELKHIGYRVSNITDALSQLIGDRPSLVIQLTKSGQSKQARKTYKVTDAGNRRVLEMLQSQ